MIIYVGRIETLFTRCLGQCEEIESIQFTGSFHGYITSGGHLHGLCLPYHHIIKTKHSEVGKDCIENYNVPYDDIIEVIWVTVAVLYLSSRLVVWMRLLSWFVESSEEHRHVTIKNIAMFCFPFVDFSIVLYTGFDKVHSPHSKSAYIYICK